MIQFAASGYIEVWHDAQLVSRHRLEREAVESCTKHGPGRYELRYPVVRVLVEGPAVAPAVGVLNIQCN